MTNSDDSLRGALTALADQAGPLGFPAARVAERVRGRARARRQAVTVLGAAAATAVVAGLAFGLHPGAPSAAPGAGQVAPSGSATATAGPTQNGGHTVYVCGQAFRAAGEAAASRDGLTLSISRIRRTAQTSGPDLAVTFTADRAITALSTRPEDVAVLYLRDGIIVGGGPLLNQPGDSTGQGSDLLPHPLVVSPEKPSVQELGPRNTLCPSVSWQDIWREPSRYEVAVLLHQPVLSTPGAPPPADAVQLLLARARLTA